jgi:hypothetical protein
MKCSGLVVVNIKNNKKQMTLLFAIFSLLFLSLIHNLML